MQIGGLCPFICAQKARGKFGWLISHHCVDKRSTDTSAAKADWQYRCAEADSEIEWYQAIVNVNGRADTVQNAVAAGWFAPKKLRCLSEPFGSSAQFRSFFPTSVAVASQGLRQVDGCLLAAS